MKYALIMGASGDIGKGIAEELAHAGWSLYLHFHSGKKSVEEQLTRYRQQYPKQDFFGLELDMTAEKDVPAFIQSIFRLDAIVFASGFTTFQLLQETLPADIDRMWAVHVKTPVLLIQQLQHKLAQFHSGRIVFISSVYGEAGSAMEVMYSTTKGAQHAFVKAYSKEVASLGITVNAIAPGAIETKMNDAFSEEEMKKVTEQIPLGRLGTVEEISFWAKQLLEPRSAYLTGQTIIVSGGWMK